MRELFVFLGVLALAGSSYAQDGWFRIHPKNVYRYWAPSGDTLYATTQLGLERTTDGGQHWEFISNFPDGYSSESEYYEESEAISDIHFFSSSRGIRTWLHRVYSKPIDTVLNSSRWC